MRRHDKVIRNQKPKRVTLSPEKLDSVSNYKMLKKLQQCNYALNFYEFQVANLKVLFPTIDNKQTILKLMTETFGDRRKMILTDKNIFNVFMKYPKILSYDGELVSIKKIIKI